MSERQNNLIFGFIIVTFVILFMAFLIWATNPNETGKKNIVIIEKYPIGIESCGRYGCTYTQPKIVDQDGILYSVPQEALWSQLKLNNTYEISWVSMNPTPYRKEINGARITESLNSPLI